MLAPYKRRRHEDEREDDRRRRGDRVYWDWREVDPDDYNPVYPFLPPPTSGTDVIVPFPMPPFASDWDFYLSNQSILNIRTQKPIIHDRNGLKLDLGDGLEVTTDGKLAVTSAGGVVKYTGTAPIVVNEGTKTISLNIDNKTLQVLNSALTAREYKGASPITVAGDLIAIQVSSGFKMNTTSSSLEVNVGDGLKFGSGGAVELDLDTTGGLQIDTSTKKLKLNLSGPMESSAVGLDIRMGPGMRTNDSGELTLAVKEPIATDDGQLQLKIGSGLQISTTGALESIATGGAITATAPLALTDDNISLTLGPGLQVDNDALRTNIISVPPLTIVDNQNENFLSMQYGQGLELDVSYGLAVNASYPLYTAPGKNNPLTLKYDQNTLRMTTTSNELAVRLGPGMGYRSDGSGITPSVTAPLTLTSNGLTISTGVGLTVNAQGQLEATGGKTTLTSYYPITVENTDTQTIIDIKIGQGLALSEDGESLILALAPTPPLVSPNGTEIMLNYKGGLIVSSDSLAINAQAPLYTGGQSPNTYLRLQTDQNTITTTTGSGLGVRFSTPIITQGQGLTVDYSAPLTLEDEKLSMAMQDPLAIDDQTNALKIRLGSGLSVDTTGALQATVSQNLTAEQPLKITDNTISLNIDHNSFLVDNTTHNLKLNVAEPLSLNETTGLGLNYDSSLQKNADNTLGVKVAAPLLLTSNGINIQVGDNITVNAGGALTATLPTYATPLTISASKEVSVNLTSGLYVTSTGHLAIRPGAGLHIEGSATPGVSYISINRGPGFSGLPGQPLTLNLNPPLRIDQNKVDLNYEAPLTVTDESVLGVAVELPLVIGSNSIELSTDNNTLQQTTSGALQVKTAAPLAASTNGVSLNYETTTLEVVNNQLKVKAVPVALKATAPVQFNTSTNTVSLNTLNTQINNKYGPLALANPVFVYQTIPGNPIRLQNNTYPEYGLADIRMIRLGHNVLFDFNIVGDTQASGTQTWTIRFDNSFGSCLSGIMRVATGQGDILPDMLPTFIVPTDDLSRASGFLPIVCSENNVFKQSTYCGYRIYRQNNNFMIELKSTTSSAKPIFRLSFMYEALYGVIS